MTPPRDRIRIGMIVDDGLARSSIATARVFEQVGLRASFAVLADTRAYPPGSMGDWNLWNELQSRGHRVHPHGLTHVNLTRIPPEQAIDCVSRCLDLFSRNLNGFDPARAVYACAYNVAPPGVIDFLRPRVRAVRIGGDPFLDHARLQSHVWTCIGFGPGDPADHLLDQIAKASEIRPAALLYCLHGLDGEGWGPIGSDRLREILEMIRQAADLEYWEI